MDITKNVVEVIGPGSTLKDGSVLIRRVVWPGGDGALIILGSGPNGLSMGCYLLNDFIAKNSGGLTDTALNIVNTDGKYLFWFPPGILFFEIRPVGFDLPFADGIYIAGPY